MCGSREEFHGAHPGCRIADEVALRRPHKSEAQSTETRAICTYIADKDPPVSCGVLL